MNSTEQMLFDSKVPKKKAPHEYHLSLLRKKKNGFLKKVSCQITGF
jgi:hypothetical protein